MSEIPQQPEHLHIFRQIQQLDTQIEKKQKVILQLLQNIDVDQLIQAASNKQRRRTHTHEQNPCPADTHTDIEHIQQDVINPAPLDIYSPLPTPKISDDINLAQPMIGEDNDDTPFPPAPEPKDPRAKEQQQSAWQVLIACRKIVSGQSFNTVQAPITKSTLADFEEILDFPVCQVSQNCSQILQLIYKSFDTAITTPQFSEIWSANCVQLLETYLATLCVGHRDTIQMVDSIPLTLHNDVVYFTYHMNALCKRSKELPVGGLQFSQQLQKLIGTFQHQAHLFFGTAFEIQKKYFSELFSQAEGLSNTHQTDRKDAVERVLKQMAHSFGDLCKRWALSLPSLLLLPALSKMLDEILTSILQVISRLGFIGSEECPVLSSLLLKFAEECRYSLNLTHSKYSALAFVSSATLDRFVRTAEIMDLSLVRIEQNLDANLYVNFEKAELISLIQSLFSDSPKRLKLINKINQTM